ncbi:hypothetical protein EDB92DRAFT_879642 [Lactarius akahatsu]|uniref:Uncharacterized protein n=1 Tax=Lactarius akahatsu TaxID=416441 RepID=A0AAD4LEC9_9AGAM|nr:hypothetical protein EDB92DRAFT_879642 [Lactarius akahatsu]
MRASAPRIIPTATAPLLGLSSFQAQALSPFAVFSSLQRHGMPSGANLTGHHSVHTGDLPYSDPVLRASSSSESFSTEYGPDETPQSEESLPPAEFARRIESTLRLHVAPDAELAAEQSPLLPPLEEGDERAEKARFIRVMQTLRRVVALVEEVESIEASLARNPHGRLEDPPTTDDLTALMQGLMGPPSSMPASAPSLIFAPTSPMVIDKPPTLLYGRTIGFAAGKGRLWAR